MANRLPSPGAKRGKGLNGREGETNVSFGKEMRQKTRQLELPLEARGDAPPGQRSGEPGPATTQNRRTGTMPLAARGAASSGETQARAPPPGSAVSTGPAASVVSGALIATPASQDGPVEPTLETQPGGRQRCRPLQIMAACLWPPRR